MAKPNYPAINAPSLYIVDLQCDWLSGTTLTVSSGQARDSTNVNDIELEEAAILNAAINGVPNALDTGALAANTLYYIHVIGDSTLVNDAASLLSASIDNPTLPFGYDMFRRVGVVKTSAGSALLDFTPSGNSTERNIWLGAEIQVLNVGIASAFTTINLSAHIPPTASEVFLQASLTPGIAGAFAALRATGSTSANGQVMISAPVLALINQAPLICPCSTINGVISIDYLVSVNLTTLTLNVSGYRDLL